MAIRKSTSTKTSPPTLPPDLENSLDHKLSMASYAVACMYALGKGGFPQYPGIIDSVTFNEVTIEALARFAGEKIDESMALLGLIETGNFVAGDDAGGKGVRHD